MLNRVCILQCQPGVPAYKAVSYDNLVLYAEKGNVHLCMCALYHRKSVYGDLHKEHKVKNA